MYLILGEMKRHSSNEEFRSTQFCKSHCFLAYSFKTVIGRLKEYFLQVMGWSLILCHPLLM